MPYDMFIVETDELFTANIAAMNMLREVMDGAGVDFDTSSTRTAAPGSCTSEEEGTLMICFISNAGWLVRPEECREIARKLSEHTETSYTDLQEDLQDLSTWDLAYIQRFSKYCETAAGAGGFYVH